MLRTKLWVLAVLALCALFLGLMLQRGVLLLLAAEPAARGIGAGFIVIAAVGAWTLWREISFGLGLQRMARVMEAEGALPEDTLPRSPGGRIDRAAADAQFEHVQAATEADPSNWRRWFALSLAYDASGDRKRARSAARRALALFQDQP